MKMFLLFRLVYSKKVTRTLLRQFHLGNNLPTHIKHRYLLAKASATAKCRGRCQKMLLRNFSSIGITRSLFHASENANVVPLVLIVVVSASECICKKRALAT